MSSGSLEPLQNPLSRVGVLRTGVNLWHNPLLNDAYWVLEAQYFVNDLVLSPANGGAYVMIGGPDALTCVRGGDEPSVDGTGVWVSLATDGVSNFSTAAPDVTGATNVYTVTASGTLSGAATSSTWLVNWQGTATGGTTAGTMSVDDIATWTVTPTGTGAVVGIMTVSPTVGVASHSWGQSVVVVCGTTGTPSIAVTGAYAGTVQTVTARVTFTRLG